MFYVGSKYAFGNFQIYILLSTFVRKLLRRIDRRSLIIQAIGICVYNSKYNSQLTMHVTY